MRHDLMKFAKGAEVRVVGKPPRVSVARVLVGLAALAASASVAHAAQAQPAGAGRLSADVVRSGGWTEVVVVVPRDFKPRGPGTPYVRSARKPGVTFGDLTPTAGVPAGTSYERTFDVPESWNGEFPPLSIEGVGYTNMRTLHEREVTGAGPAIAEGGMTHRDVWSTYGPDNKPRDRRADADIPDPSEAFMNLAAATYKANTGATWEASVDAVEGAHRDARWCTADLGTGHDCSVTTGGVTFDYGSKDAFSARLDVRDAGRTRRSLVAVETRDGLAEGASFPDVMHGHVEPEAPRFR